MPYTVSKLVMPMTITICVFLFFMYALSLEETDFLMDVLKLVMGAFGGFGIGYVLGKKKSDVS